MRSYMMMDAANSLITLGVGYLVLVEANKEKENLRTAGFAIGILVMIVAVAGAWKCTYMGGSGGGLGKGPMCSFMAAAAKP